MDRAEGAAPLSVVIGPSGKHLSKSIRFAIGEPDQTVLESPVRSRIPQPKGNLGAHLGRKAEGMVTTSTIGVISSQAPKGRGPRGRFRDRTVGRWSLRAIAQGTILPPRERGGSEGKDCGRWSLRAPGLKVR